MAQLYDYVLHVLFSSGTCLLFSSTKICGRTENKSHFKDFTDTKGKNSVAPNLEFTKFTWKNYWRFKLIVNMLLNSLVNVLDINDNNDVIKIDDVTKNVACRSLAP